MCTLISLTCVVVFVAILFSNLNQFQAIIESEIKSEIKSGGESISSNKWKTLTTQRLRGFSKTDTAAVVYYLKQFHSQWDCAEWTKHQQQNCGWLSDLDPKHTENCFVFDLGREHTCNIKLIEYNETEQELVPEPIRLKSIGLHGHPRYSWLTCDDVRWVYEVNCLSMNSPKGPNPTSRNICWDVGLVVRKFCGQPTEPRNPRYFEKDPLIG